MALWPQAWKHTVKWSSAEQQVLDVLAGSPDLRVLAGEIKSQEAHVSECWRYREGKDRYRARFVYRLGVRAFPGQRDDHVLAVLEAVAGGARIEVRVLSDGGLISRMEFRGSLPRNPMSLEIADCVIIDAAVPKPTRSARSETWVQGLLDAGIVADSGDPADPEVVGSKRTELPEVPQTYWQFISQVGAAGVRDYSVIGAAELRRWNGADGKSYVLLIDLGDEGAIGCDEDGSLWHLSDAHDAGHRLDLDFSACLDALGQGRLYEFLVSE